MIMTKKELTALEIEQKPATYAEAIALEVKTQNKGLMVITTYVAPKTSCWGVGEHEQLILETQDILSDLLQKGEAKSQEIVLMGDFNCDINWETLEAKHHPHDWNENLLNLITDHCLHQHVNQPTRVRGTDRPSMLDLIFTRQPEDITDINYGAPLGKSDHAVLDMKYWTNIVKNKKQYKESYNYKKGDYNGLREYFKKTNWERELTITDINQQNSKFLDFYYKGVDKFIPKTKQRETPEDNQEWFNGRCKRARDNKELLWTRYNRHRSARARARYNEARNSYTEIRREAQINYEKDIINKSKEQPKLFYNFINSKTKKREHLLAITDEGNTYDNEKDMSEVLNKKFQSVFTTEPSFDGIQDPPVPKRKLGKIKLTKKKVLEALKKLDKRKAMGPDEVSPWVLKECAEELCLPIFMIFTSSLEQGKLPDIWKSANITPIFKKGNKSNPLNYRPVSLTSVICKMLERIIREEWVDMLEQQKILTGKQFGFRQGRSCVSNLLCYYDRVSEIMQDREGWVDSIYLDFSKAFDKVPHKRLIWKLQHIGGVSDMLLEWMKDFLQGRQMRTVIRGTASQNRDVTSGVPQGSVLAPIMFLIYVNDLGEDLSENTYINMFADDAKIQRRIKDSSSCKELQEDIHKIKAWSTKWKMDFNVEKCHVVRFGESEKRPIWQYKLGDEIIPSADKEKDLGVVIQKKLDPEDHINQITSKMYHLLANMKTAFTYVDTDMVRKIITTYIRPTLEYASVVWNPYHVKDENKLERIQRAATRWAPELRDLSYEERLKALNLPSLQERRKRGAFITLYKCTTGMMEIDNPNFIQYSERTLRGHSKKLQKKRGENRVRQNFFPNGIVDEWNKLPEQIVSAKNINQFKNLYDKMTQIDGTI